MVELNVKVHTEVTFCPREVPPWGMSFRSGGKNRSSKSHVHVPDRQLNFIDEAITTFETHVRSTWNRRQAIIGHEGSVAYAYYGPCPPKTG